MGTIKQVERCPGGPSGLVKACTTMWLAHLALVDQHFSPRTPATRHTGGGNFRIGRIRTTPSSDRPKANMRLPAASSGRWATFCASLPHSCNGLMPKLAAAPGVIATLWL